MYLSLSLSLRKESKFIGFPKLWPQLIVRSSVYTWLTVQVIESGFFKHNFTLDVCQHARAQVRYSTRYSTRDCSKPCSLSSLVYINDLPCSISSDCSIFADDTSVYNTGSKLSSLCSVLSKDLNYAADWAADRMGNALQCREKWTAPSNFNKKIRQYKSSRNNEWNTNPTSHLPQALRSQLQQHAFLAPICRQSLHVLYSKNMNDPAITTKAAPDSSEANLLGSSTAKIGIRMPSVVWWTNTERL